MLFCLWQVDINRLFKGTIGKETIKTYLSIQKAEENRLLYNLFFIFFRDSIAKFFYQRIFEWVVCKINQMINCGEREFFSIGILDIFGFYWLINSKRF